MTLESSADPSRGLGAAVVVPWIAFWGWVALDSALAYRKSQGAIDEAVAADPISELYDGPAPQKGAVGRWLLWSPATLDRLRRMRKRARASMIGAPIIAVAGPLLLRNLFARRPRG